MMDTMKLGHFEIRGLLGHGAMAKVWRAWDPKLEREVAIKEPLFDERLDEDVLAEMGARFVKEGKAAARLNHPGIVTIYVADIYDTRPVIVMELVDGMTLSEMLHAGALSPQVTLDVLDQLLDAVGYAHLQGVVHRDIKPDNIFITADGRIKLSDFGIARMDDSPQGAPTQIGTVLGTPGYMAPEQAMGTTVDNRTDLFAIGTIAYEMLTGSNPFGSGANTNTASLLYRIAHEPAPELPDIASEGLPADIRPAILAALNKNPLDRPQDAASFKAMLRGAPVPRAGILSPAASTPADTSAFVPAVTQAATPTVEQKAPHQNKWLPYVITAGVGALATALIFLFADASCGGAGGGGQSGSGAGSSGAAIVSSAPLLPSGVDVGDTINMGEVSFDAFHAGTFSDDIEWQVLAVESNRVLVISKDIVDLRPYHEERKDITWEDSDLRSWLNNEFYEGLPSGLQAQILEATKDNPDSEATSGGNPTEDKVFLLSVSEAEHFFSSNKSRRADISLADSTHEYMINMWGRDLKEYVKEHGGYRWWLRSPGTSGSENAAHAYRGGSLNVKGEVATRGDCGVRPAMWISR
ncbi:MAG: serine/threonine protein kinase [Coriobacteriia bacterium]|nr:serine/threonine protein kinase [Coriobacteriia bacterium]